MLTHVQALHRWGVGATSTQAVAIHEVKFLSEKETLVAT